MPSLFAASRSLVTGKREVLICLALALLTSAAYCRIFSNGFVNWDDDYYVYRNPATTIGLRWPAVKWAFTTTFAHNWHPLTWLSLEADNQLFGLNPAGYHATSLFLHVAATLTLYFMLRNLTGSILPSTCAAAFFALHPLHVEVVAWVTERTDLLSTLFFFLSIVVWQRYATSASGRAYAGALLLFLCSLMSKAMGVSLPFVLLLLDAWPLRRMAHHGLAAKTASVWHAGWLIVEKLPFFALSGMVSLIVVIAQGGVGAMNYGKSLSLIEQCRLVPVNYVTYIAKMFWPLHLAVLYPHPGAAIPYWKPVGATLLLFAITAVCLRLRKSRPHLIVGWCWFLVTLLPVIGTVQLARIAATADRYLYMPMVGLLLMLCWAGVEFAATARCLKLVLAAVCTSALAVCGWLTFCQVGVWHDSLSLWQHALSLAPPTFLSCNNYAQALEQAGRLDEAERWYRKALKLDPKSYYPNLNLGVILGKKGDEDAAEYWYRKALEIDPDSGPPNLYLGTILLKKGEQDEAAERLRIALRSEPNNPALLENLGIAEELRGRYDVAIDYYQRSARLDPRSPRIQEHLRRVLKKRGGG